MLRLARVGWWVAPPFLPASLRTRAGVRRAAGGGDGGSCRPLAEKWTPDRVRVTVHGGDGRSSPARGRWRREAVTEGEVGGILRYEAHRLPPPPPFGLRRTVPLPLAGEDLGAVTASVTLGPASCRASAPVWRLLPPHGGVDPGTNAGWRCGWGGAYSSPARGRGTVRRQPNGGGGGRGRPVIRCAADRPLRHRLCRCHLPLAGEDF